MYYFKIFGIFKLYLLINNLNQMENKVEGQAESAKNIVTRKRAEKVEKDAFTQINFLHFAKIICVSPILLTFFFKISLKKLTV